MEENGSTADVTTLRDMRYSPDSALNDNDLDPAARALYEQYSGLARSEVIPHILRIRAAAFKIYPYPCIGQFRFLQFSIALHPSYPRILERLKAPSSGPESAAPVLLDIGCCLGQDLRKLAFDGVPGDRLVGMELEQGFIDLGFELFRDKKKFQGAMIAANVLDSSFDSLFEAMAGRFEVVHAASFFHLADWDLQVQVAIKILKMMKDQIGVIVMGRQVGSTNPRSHAAHSGHMRYLHDPTSLQKQWDEIGEKTSTKWEVKSWVDLKSFGKGVGSAEVPQQDGGSFITFEITRVA